MRHYWKYFKHVFWHKFYVFKAGRMLGVPVLNLIIHDWDKLLSWKMFRSYANYYNNFENLMTEERAEHLKYTMPDYPWREVYTQEKCVLEYNQTWNRHQHISKHHWQSAIRNDDDGTVEVMAMDEKDWREMAADWKSFELQYPKGQPLSEWYASTRRSRRLHPVTQRNVEKLLGIESYDVIDNA